MARAFVADRHGANAATPALSTEGALTTDRCLLAGYAGDVRRRPRALCEETPRKAAGLPGWPPPRRGRFASLHPCLGSCCTATGRGPVKQTERRICEAATAQMRPLRRARETGRRERLSCSRPAGEARRGSGRGEVTPRTLKNRHHFDQVIDADFSFQFYQLMTKSFRVRRTSPRG